jgi:MFS family permease
MGLFLDLRASAKPLAGFVAIGVAWSTYFAQMPAIKANVGATDGAYGLAILIASLGALGAMWLAPVAQRALGGRAVTASILLVAAGMSWAGLSGTLLLLTIGMMMAAAGSGVTDVLVNARIAEIEAREGRSLMNLNHAIYSFAYAGAALLTGLLREAGVGRLLPFAGLAAVLVFLAWAARDRAPDLEAEGADVMAGEMPHALVILAGLVVMAAFMAEAASEGWSALHLERTLGGSPGQGALGPAMMGLTMGFGRLTGHALARLMRDTTLIFLALLVSASGLVLAGMAPGVGLALTGFALAGLGISVVAPLALALVGRRVPPRARLAAISRASVLGYGAFFVGPPLMGMVSEVFGLRASFVVIAGVLVVTAMVLVPALVRRVDAGTLEVVAD